MSDTANVTVIISGDASALAKALEDAITNAIGDSMATITKRLSTLTNQFSRGNITKGITKGFEQATIEIREMGVQLRNLVDLTQTGFTRGFRAATDSINDMDDALGRSERRIRDISDQFQRMGAVRGLDEGLTEVIRLSGRAEQATDELADARERAARDPGFRQAINTEVRARQQAASRETDLLQEQTRVFRTELAKQFEQQRVTQQGITTAAKAEASERIVDQQTAAAREVAITKRSAQQRVEIIRAVVGQIRALERGIAAVFRTSASAFGKFTSAAGRTVGKLGSIFSKSDAQLANGLRGPMSRRESILRSSMSRQERIIQSSVVRQSALVTRLETASSRGIAGVVSGRSQLGSLLGGGLAIGGAVGLISTVKRLATVSADFEQTMSVLDAQLHLTDRQMENVRQTSIDLGNDMSLPGVSAKDAGEAISIMSKQFGSLGKDAPAAAQAAAKGVLQLSRAAGVGAAEAGQVVGAAVNVFGVSADKAVAVADQVTGALAKAAGVGFTDFALAFKQGASVFELFQGGIGPPLETLTQFNTALAVLARNAITGSDAGTSLKQFFLQATRNAAPARAALHEVAKRAGEMGSVFFDQEGAARPLTKSIDILRKGLDGMSDAQRTSTLSTIFGSDALRTANAFLKVSGKEWEKIEKSIRDEGLAAEIAAAQNTGLRGAMDAFGSVIDTIGIEVGAKLNKPLGNAVLFLVDLFNKLRSGEGAFARIRTALKGVALGLGSILAVKGVIEIFKFLLILARGLLTPMGLLLTVAGLVGAAFTLMMENSEAFRDAIGEIVPKLQEFGETVIEFVKDRLTDVADFIGTTVIPAIQRFVEFIATHALAGIRAFGDFFRAEIIPRLQAFVSFITGTVVPAVVDKFVAAFNFARDAIKSFWDVAEPILRPAIDGIMALADAVGELFDLEPSKGLLAIGGILAAAVGGFAVAGPVGGLVAGLGATVAAIFATGLGDELVDIFQGLGSGIVDALKGPLETVRNFLADFFSSDNLKDLTFGFLDLVEELGRIIGSIVSDPRLVTAIAGIGAFAVTVGFRFIVGVARGIRDNLDELGKLLVDGLKIAGEAGLKALGEVFTDPKLILTAITAVFLGPAFISLFRRAGTQAGTTFLGGLKSVSFGGAFAGGGITARGGAGGSFIQALLGRAPGAEVAKVMRGVSSLMSSEMRRMRSTLQASGRQFTPTTFGISQAFRQLSQDVGPSGVAGLELRAKIQASINALKTLSLQPLRNLGLSTTQIFTTIGKTAAGALAAGFAGFQTGQGLAGQSVLSQVLGVGGLALALGAVNPALGLAAGAAGVAGIAFGNMGEDASGAAERVRALDDALQGVTDPTETLISSTTSAFSDLSSELQQALGHLNFNIPEFIDGVEQGRLGQEQFVDMLTTAIPELDLLATGFRTGKSSAVDFIEAIEGQDAVKRLGFDADFLNEMLTFMSQQGGSALVALKNFQNRAGVTADTVEGLTPEMQALGAGFGAMFAQPTEDQLNAALEFANEQTQAAEESANEARTAYENLLSKDYRKTLQGALDDLQTDLGDIGKAVTGTNLADDVSDAVREASKRLAVGQARLDFAAVLDIAVTTGEVDLKGTAGDINRVQAQVTTALQTAFDQGDITAEAHVALQAIVDKFFDDPHLVNKTRRMLRRQRQAAEAAAREAALADPVQYDQPVTVTPGPFSVKGIDLPAIRAAGRRLRQQLRTERRNLPVGAVASGISVPIDVQLDPNYVLPPATKTNITSSAGRGQGIGTALGAASALDAIPVDIPMRPNFIAPGFTSQDLQTAVLSGSGGGQGIGTALGAASALEAIPITVPLDLTYVVEGGDAHKAVQDFLSGGGPGPQGFGGGGESRGIGGGAGASVDIPITATPVVTVPAAAGGALAVVKEAVVAKFDGAKVNVPLTVNPVISVPAAAGGALAIVKAAVVSKFVGASVNVPVAVNPAVSGGNQSQVGAGIGQSVAAGISSSAPQIAAALNTAIGQALRQGGQLTAQFGAVGTAAAEAFADGVVAGQAVIVQASTAVSNAAVVAVAANQGVMVIVGVSLGASFAEGVGSQSGASFSAGASLGSSARSGAQGFSLYSTGLDMAFGLASGIRSGASAVINAAISIAQAAISAARRALQVTSPSKVFRNIGRDVGRGLAEGIKDSETDITSAVNTAIDDAIEAAQRRMPRRVASAGLGAGLFARTTLPSRIPGGVPNIEAQRTALAALDALQEIVDLDKERNQQADDLRQEIRDTKKGLREDLKSLKEEMVSAIVTRFEKPAAGLDIRRQVIDLGGLPRQFAKAFEEIIPDLEIEKAVEGETAEEAAAREKRNQASRDARNQALENAKALRISTGAGRDTSNMFLDFGQQIRDLGTSMLESGVPAARVITQMQKYRNQLIEAAKDAGISSKGIREMIGALGLSDKQLASFGNGVDNIREKAKEAAKAAREAADKQLVGLREELKTTTSTSLGTGTAAGRVNRTIVTEAMDAIREFGTTALEAGQPVAAVVQRMKEMRNELVTTLVSMGFNQDQIKQLVELMGLSNEQLRQFTGNLAAANNEFQNPVVPRTPGLTIGPGGRLPTQVRDVHVHVPFGDPEAVALATTNRLAFELNAPV